MGKVCDLARAAELVQDGDVVALGGNGVHRSPAAFVRALAEAGRIRLGVVKTAGAYDVDFLCRAGCVSAVVAGYVGFESEFGMAPSFRRAVEQGRVHMQENACYSVIAALRAAAQGVPFMPVAGMEGSDLLRQPHFARVRDPFTGVEVVVVRALRPDWAIVHVHEADVYGNARIRGPVFEDVLMTRAARRVIVTAERLADDTAPDEGTVIPGFLVDAVVECPGGARPGSCYPLYDYDRETLTAYLNSPDPGRPGPSMGQGGRACTDRLTC